MKQNQSTSLARQTAEMRQPAGPPDREGRLPAPIWVISPEEAVLPAERQRRPGLLGRIRGMRPPRFEDPGQRRSFGAILRFFALVLLLTLVARGTAGATLAQVQTATPQGNEVKEQVRGEGLVSAGNSLGIKAPEGLTLDRVLVTPGQQVEAGDPVAKFDPEEVAELLAKEKAALGEKQAKLKELQSGKAHDDSTLQSARSGLKWAEQGVGDAANTGNANIAAAQAALDAANAKLAAAREHRKSLTAEATNEEREAAREAMSQAEAERDTAAAKLDSERASAAEASRQAEKELENARNTLRGAEVNDANARKDEADAAANNQALANTQRLEIEAQQKKIAELEALEDGVLKAETGGIVLETAAVGGKTDGTPILQLSDVSGGYEAEVMLPKGDAEKLKPGMTVELVADGGSYYAPVVEGSLKALSAPDENGQVKATIRLPGEDWKLGQSVTANILRSKKRYEQTVPLSALHQDSDGYYLLGLVEQSGVLGTENRVTKIPVNLLAKDSQNAAVEGALGYGEPVITSSSKPIEPDDRVRVSAS